MREGEHSDDMGGPYASHTPSHARVRTRAAETRACCEMRADGRPACLAGWLAQATDRCALACLPSHPPHPPETPVAAQPLSQNRSQGPALSSHAADAAYDANTKSQGRVTNAAAMGFDPSLGADFLTAAFFLGTNFFLGASFFLATFGLVIFGLAT